MTSINVEVQQLILFWIFLGFFLVIGIISLLSILGVIPIEERFRKWAITGFVVPVIGVMIPLANEMLFPIKLQDVNVVLESPEEVKPETLVLVSGTYEYTRQSPSEESARLSGKFDPINPVGAYWQAIFPYLPPAQGKPNRTVKLTLRDNTGHLWYAGLDPRYTRAKINISTETPQNQASKSFFKLQLITDSFADNSSSATPICAHYPTKIKFNNWAKPSGKEYGGREYYKWRLFVDEDEAVLNCIDEVQYMLHPTFQNPLQIRRNPGDKFAVEMSGWGVFLIDISVKLKNRKVLNTNYTLDFKKSWP